MTNIKKLVTHNGSFHADDIFACATLCLMLEKNNEKFEIIRTRDSEIIEKGDYVFDVGGIYDQTKNRFDHHQKGGAGNRTFEGVNVEYAAFGLVWKKYGIEICDSENAVLAIDRKLVAPIDAFDNGLDLVENKFKISPYLIQHLFFSMRPTWKEGDSKEDEMFERSLQIAKEILVREIIQVKDSIAAEVLVISAYESAKDKKIIVMDEDYPCQYTLSNFPEPLFAVSPREISGTWAAKAVRNDPKTFKSRKDFPQAWAGLRDIELQKATGVVDAIFCHRGLFLAVAKSKEGAVKLAQIAVES